MHLVAANVSSSRQLPANGSIELAFDRLLLPSCITRQTFILQQNTLTPTVAYDPVTRVVTITPTEALTPGQTYTLGIATPQSATDLFGLRAIDGATLDPTSPALIDFQVSAATASSPPAAPTIDFCNDVFAPVFQTCGGTGCHGSVLPAAGLLLTTTAGLAQTAIGRVAHGSNTGPLAAPQPPGLLFDEDMPIIDPGTGTLGDPGDSWVLYKMLMAIPSADTASSCDAGANGGSAVADATIPDATGGADDAPAAAEGGTSGEGGAGDAGAADDAGEDAAPAATPPTPTTPATDVCGVYSVPWKPITAQERMILANLVPGREMPYPAALDAGVGTGVSVDALERVSLWIAQGASVPAGGCLQ